MFIRIFLETLPFATPGRLNIHRSGPICGREHPGKGFQIDNDPKAPYISVTFGGVAFRRGDPVSFVASDPRNRACLSGRGTWPFKRALTLRSVAVPPFWITMTGRISCVGNW